MYKFLKKYHKWIGLIIAVLVILFSISGIILNHRETFSTISIDRNYLPKEYKYQKWNNAAVRATVQLAADSFLIYGNIGIWKTDSNFTKYDDFNAGFPNGIDNRKTFKVLKTENGLLAGTLFGLYEWNSTKKSWIKITLPTHEENVVDMLSKGDSVYIMTRSNIMLTKNYKHFEIVNAPPYENYDNKISLFKTLWMIHSGEIYGYVGKLLVDLAALIFVFLSVGGIILFFSKRGLKNKSKEKNERTRHKKRYKWNIKWHNRIGWITGLFLVITTLTGMFLRPPLLIAIAEARVGKIPFTELDTPNPWFDLLRRMIYIPEDKLFIISTSEGFYYSDVDFNNKMKRFDIQPPASIMGVTVLNRTDNNEIIVGSFEGLFRWNYKTGTVYDVIKKKPYIRPIKKGPPVGDYKITGYSEDFKQQPIVFDYTYGSINIDKKSDFPPTPTIVLKKTPMSLWTLALEVHTGRIYNAIIGIFYFLVVPLVGLLVLFILLSGIIIWFKHHRK